MATYAVARDFGLGGHKFVRPPIDSLATARAHQYNMPGAERSGRKAEFSPQKAESWRIRVRKFFTGKRTKRATVYGDISYENQRSPARVARSRSWAAPEALKVEKGRVASASFNEQSPPRKEQESSPGAQASELVRLTLRPKGSVLDVEVHQVTLRRRVEGFGLHLSAGLPPITVTFVEPGSEAEQAGVCVGDLVLEVNGQDCLQTGDITRLLELKMLIQQVEITETHSNGSSGLKEEITVDGHNDTWKEIKAGQTNDENDPLKSSDFYLPHIKVELTLIDDVLDDSDEVTTTVSVPVQIPKGDKQMKAESTIGTKAAKSSKIGPKKKGGKKKRKKRMKTRDKTSNPPTGSDRQNGQVSGESNVQVGDEEDGTEPLSAKDDGRTAAVANSEDSDDGSKLASNKDGGTMLQDSDSDENKAQPVPHDEDAVILPEEPQAAPEYSDNYQMNVKQLSGQERIEDDDGVAVNQIGDFNRPTAQESAEDHRQLSAIDLSNVPWTAPSLGLREGRARRELEDHRLSKRHPATQQLPLLRGQDESQKLTMESVTLVGAQWIPAASDSGGLGKLVSPLEDPERSGSESRTSTVGHLPKTPASTESSLPEWVTIAQVKAKQANRLLDNNSPACSPPLADGRHSSSSCLPRQGHVAEKLAFFKSL